MRVRSNLHTITVVKSHVVRVAELSIPIEVKKLAEGDYLATSRVLRGLVVQGRTISEAIEIAQDVARKLIESHLEHGDPLPSAVKKQLRKREKTAHFQIPVPVNF